MLRRVLHSKLHMLRVTGVNVRYSGSLGIDADLLAAAGLRSHDAVLVGNCRSGARFESYLIPLAAGSRAVEVNGAAARLAEVGDRLIVLHFALLGPEEYAAFRPTVVLLREDNTIAQTLRYDPT